MRSIRFETIVVAAALSVSFACATVLAQAQKQKPSYGSIGTTPTKADMGNLAWTAGPSGKSLPPGSGTAKQGYPIFIGHCSMCHGTNAQGVALVSESFSPTAGPPLAGGKKMQGWYVWTYPFSETLFNTIAVEMPMYHPGTLTADQVYALTAFILYKNGYIKEDQVMNRETLPKVKMPNRNSFPKTDAPYMDMQKRGCYKTYGDCMGN
jgi:S-disulfanyl-L-cysteine oxidoreductase SoxD